MYGRADFPMLNKTQSHLRELIESCLSQLSPSPQDRLAVEVEIPSDRRHGEFATNIALKSAKIFRQAPMAIAEKMLPLINAAIRQGPLAQKIERVDIKAPGFINFYLSREALYDVLHEIFSKKESYGASSVGAGTRVQLEFVSANPTGPLSVAHARQAAVGDALGNILKFLGFDAVKEFYVNDEGNQINLLGESVRLQAQKLLTGEDPDGPLPYQGEYLIDIARDFLKDHRIADANQLKEHVAQGRVRDYAVAYLMKIIKKELDDFGVHFDVWSHQSQIAAPAQVAALLEAFKKQGHCYEKDGAWWFRSTTWGDDKDRVVKKSDGTYTYLAPDIAYHKNKYDRGFTKLINLWGPDHHGYIPRIKAAASALGHDPDSLVVLIVQLATISREGKPVSMSTRKGQYIQLREVIDEVGPDAARFFFLMRHLNVHLDFDLELAKKESPENPVYYIQYAHARIHSIFTKAQEVSVKAETATFDRLVEAEEMTLLKTLGYFPDILNICYQELDPYALVSYLMTLATDFHKFYDRHRVVDPAEPDLSAQRLGLIEAVRITLANGLGLLGVSRPQKM